MRRFFLTLGLLTCLVVESKPYSFRFGNFRIAANQDISGIFRSDNDLTIILANNKQEFVSTPGVVLTVICKTRLDFTDLFDQIVTGKVFDLTTTDESGKVNISFIVTPGCASGFAGMSSDASVIDKGRVTILSSVNGRITLSYNGTIANYDMFDEANLSMTVTHSTDTLKLSGIYSGIVD